MNCAPLSCCYNVIHISAHLAAQVSQPELKAANFVAKWLGYGAQSLGPVVKKDGSTEERLIETWVPKKKVKAYSLRWGRREILTL